MLELNYISKNHKVCIYSSPTTVPKYIHISLDGEQIAYFRIEELWDMMKEHLCNISTSVFPGLTRRSYEASNIHRLTTEFIKSQD